MATTPLGALAVYLRFAFPPPPPQWKEFFSSTRIVKAAKVSQDKRWRLSSFNPLPISIVSPAHWQPPHPTAAANCLPRPTVRQFFFLLRLFEQCFHSMPSAEINSIARVERVRFLGFLSWQCLIAFMMLSRCVLVTLIEKKKKTLPNWINKQFKVPPVALLFEKAAV